MYDVPGTQNTHKIGTYYTKQMVMMMQAFLSCRVNVAIELRCLYVFRLNYVKGKCCTCTHTLHTGLCDGVRRQDENLFLYFVSIFVDFFLFAFFVCSTYFSLLYP